MSRPQVAPNSYSQQKAMQQRVERLERVVGQLTSVLLQASNNLSDVTNVTTALTNLGIGGITSAWNSYTPTWTGSTTNPAIGNGSITGRYLLIGKTCVLQVQISFGSTTTAGSGNYLLSLPIAIQGTIAQMLSTKFWTGSAQYAGFAECAGGTTATPNFSASATATNLNQWSSTLLGAPNTGNFHMFGVYETL